MRIWGFCSKVVGTTDVTPFNISLVPVDVDYEVDGYKKVFVSTFSMYLGIKQNAGRSAFPYSINHIT